MKVCVLCGREVEIEKLFSRKSDCPHCGGDLHICLNCRFYSETSHNKCLEPKAEYQRSRDRANFCEYFEYGEGGGQKAGAGDPREEARRKLDDLFGG
jgi:predicted RNA-binding Zn-ribbon protein involved in translation (DUF1610 family)